MASMSSTELMIPCSLDSHKTSLLAGGTLRRQVTLGDGIKTHDLQGGAEKASWDRTPAWGFSSTSIWGCVD